MYSVQKSTESFYFGLVHGLSTDCAQLSLWTSGQLQNPVGLDEHENIQNYGVEGFVDEYSGEDSRPIFESFSTMISQECQNASDQEFNQNCLSVGIDDFQRCLDIVERYTNT